MRKRKKRNTQIDYGQPEKELKLEIEIENKIIKEVKKQANKERRGIVAKPNIKAPSTKQSKKYLTYFMVDRSTGYTKIGRSTKPSYRERTLQAEKPTIELVQVFNGDYERGLHWFFRKKRLRGEWFNLTEGDRIAIEYAFSEDVEKRNKYLEGLTSFLDDPQNSHVREMYNEVTEKIQRQINLWNRLLCPPSSSLLQPPSQ